MQASLSNDHPLHRWFRGLVEDAFFAHVGICDPQLADYLAAMLCDFIHTDHIFLIRDAAGQRLRQVAEMLARAACPPGQSERNHRRVLHRHIGDFTLFWTGIYPESLRRRSRSGEVLIDYLSQGKRSYAIASELSSDAAPPPAALLRRLSEEFEACVHGLSLVRRGWEEQDPGSFSSTHAILK
ncbi:MAG: hypothetical protein U1A27_08315 [Phycisphaerae bacterium]